MKLELKLKLTVMNHPNSQGRGANRGATILTWHLLQFLLILFATILRLKDIGDQRDSFCAWEGMTTDQFSGLDKRTAIYNTTQITQSEGGTREGNQK